MSKPVLLKLDEDLVVEIDRVRGDVPRTVWIVRACERALETRPVGKALTAALTNKPAGMGTADPLVGPESRVEAPVAPKPLGPRARTVVTPARRVGKTVALETALGELQARGTEVFRASDRIQLGPPERKAGSMLKKPKGAP